MELNELMHDFSTLVHVSVLIFLLDAAICNCLKSNLVENNQSFRLLLSQEGKTALDPSQVEWLQHCNGKSRSRYMHILQTNFRFNDSFFIGLFNVNSLFPLISSH